jgi:hypothetical protein
MLGFVKSSGDERCVPLAGTAIYQSIVYYYALHEAWREGQEAFRFLCKAPVAYLGVCPTLGQQACPTLGQQACPTLGQQVCPT